MWACLLYVALLNSWRASSKADQDRTDDLVNKFVVEQRQLAAAAFAELYGDSVSLDGASLPPFETFVENYVIEALNRETKKILGSKGYATDADTARWSPMQQQQAGASTCRAKGGVTTWRGRLPWLRDCDDEDPPWSIQLGSKGSDSKGIVLAVPAYGIGNRLLGAASVAALALALNRSFHIMWEDPNFEDLVVSKGIDRSTVRIAYEEKGTEVVRLRGLSPELLQSVESIACHGTNLDNIGILQVETDQFFLPILQLGNSTGNWKAVSVALGTSHENDTMLELASWSRTLLQGLFTLTSYARAVVESEAARLLDGATFVLGVHVRTKMYDFESDTVPGLEIHDLFDCVEEALFVETAANTREGAVIFLATTSSSVKSAFQERFGEKLRTREDIVVDRLTVGSEEDAIVDLALLGASNALVTSVHSTFGYVAQVLANVRPYVVTASEASTLDGRKSKCIRPPSPVPCFHLGQRLATQLSCGPPHDDLRTAYGPWSSCWF